MPPTSKRGRTTSRTSSSRPSSYPLTPLLSSVASVIAEYQITKGGPVIMLQVSYCSESVLQC
jgi:hypothetical protein